jgi:hypothetical protein
LTGERLEALRRPETLCPLGVFLDLASADEALEVRTEDGATIVGGRTWESMGIKMRLAGREVYFNLRTSSPSSAPRREADAVPIG